MYLFIALYIGVLSLAIPGVWRTMNNWYIDKRVYSVCNGARQEYDTDSERRCGEFQDKYSREFLCEQRNSSPDNRCWVERT